MPNPSAWILHVTDTARNKVHMAVHYRLASHFSGVDSDVESFHGLIPINDFRSLRINQLLNGAAFGTE